MDLEHKAKELLDLIQDGAAHAVGQLFELYRDRLLRMLSVRLDPRLSSRISPEDVLQDAFLDVSSRIDDFLADPCVPFYVWLRYLVLQRMHLLERTHLRAAIRTVRREVELVVPKSDFADANSMAGQFVSVGTSPTHAVIRQELHHRIRKALDEMHPLDREILALRHFEELHNNEIAKILNISKHTASKRYIRALDRLREILSNFDAPTSS